MLVLLSVLACQSDTHPAFSPRPSPSPHTRPTAAILQSADVPSTLNVCVGSGPMDVYLSVLARNEHRAWHQLVYIRPALGTIGLLAPLGFCRAGGGRQPGPDDVQGRDGCD